MRSFSLAGLAAVLLLASAASAVALSTPPLSLQGSAQIDTGTKTAAAVSGAATLNKLSGVVTTESLSTAAGAVYTLTITDSAILATDLVQVSVQNGTNSAGSPDVTTVTPANGSLVIKVQNIHASAAFNGTLKVAFVSFKN